LVTICINGLFSWHAKCYSLSTFKLSERQVCMSQNSNFLKTTLDLLETDPEVKSYIYQQILDFNQFVTPETLVMVVARDPHSLYSDDIDEENLSEDELEFLESQKIQEQDEVAEGYNYRIGIVLKDGDSSIEAEAFHDDIFEAIRLAKDKLVARLLEIQEEIESPQERMNAIKEASDNKQIH
jgi:ribosome-associated translation inhibitor RaiA